MKKLFTIIAVGLSVLSANAQCVQSAQSAQINASANPLILCNPSTELLTVTLDPGTYDFIQWVRKDVSPVQILSTGSSFLADRWTIGSIAVRVWCSGSYIESEPTNVNRFDIELPQGQDNLLCFGQAADLSVPNVPGLIYSWSVGNLTSTTVNTTPTYTTAFTDNIWCKITQPVGGCFKYAKFRLSKPKNCGLVTLKTPENPYILCKDQYGYLTPTIPGGGTFDSVQWFRNGLYLKKADTLFLDRWSVGNYNAIAWFMGTVSNVTNTIPVNRFDINIKAGDGRLCGNETVTLVAPSLHQPTLYQWSVGDFVGVNMVLQGNTDSIFTTNFIGNVWCMLTHDGSCYKYAKFRVVEENNCPTGAKPSISYKMDENEISAFELAIFPNPNKGLFKIAVDGLELSSVVSIEIFDLTGRKVYSSSQMTSDRQEVYEINGGSFAPGMYSVRVSNANSAISTRIIVE